MRMQNTVTYLLSDDAGGLFTIDETGGRSDRQWLTGLRLALATTSRCLQKALTAAPHRRASRYVTDDENDNIGVVFDEDPTINQVAEKLPAGTSVGITAFAASPNQSENVTYELIDNAGGLFYIDQLTGVVKTSAPLDYEAASTYDISVLAKGGDGSSTSNSFQIYVEEVDEWFDPVFTKKLAF